LEGVLYFKGHLVYYFKRDPILLQDLDRFSKAHRSIRIDSWRPRATAALIAVADRTDKPLKPPILEYYPPYGAVEFY